MSTLAVIMAVIELVKEVLKLINRYQTRKDENEKERIKRATEAAQSGIRGIIDRDESRIRLAFDRQRELRK